MRRPILLLTTLGLLATGLSSAPAVEPVAARAPCTPSRLRRLPARQPVEPAHRPATGLEAVVVIVAGQAAGADLHLDLGTTGGLLRHPGQRRRRGPAAAAASAPGWDGEGYGDESDPGPVFIPADVAIEGGSDAPPIRARVTDVPAVRRATCDLVELYAAERVRDACGAVVGRPRPRCSSDLSFNGSARPGRTSADVAGLPIRPGLLDDDEAASGRITHALRFTLPDARSAYTWPARHCGPSGNTGRDLPAYGLRFRSGVVPDQARHRRRRAHRGGDEALRAHLRRPGIGDVRHWHGRSALGRRARSVPARPLDGKALEVVKPWRRVVRC